MKTNRCLAILALAPLSVCWSARPLASQTIPKAGWEISGDYESTREYEVGGREQGWIAGDECAFEVGKNDPPHSEHVSHAVGIVVVIDLLPDTLAMGFANVWGQASGSISAGVGYMNCGIHAKSKVKYADVVVKAEDQGSFFLTTEGSPISVGVGGQVFGTGITFSGTYIKLNLNQKKTVSISDVDSGLKKEATQVNIDLLADVEGELWLDSGGKGELSAEASAGALVELEPKPKDGF